MKRALLPFLFAASLASQAQDVVIDVQAADYTGQVVLLYRYDDLFTLRAIRVTESLIGDSGKATLSAPVEGTAKFRLRIGEVTADLFARAGKHYRVTFIKPEARVARTVSGTARTTLFFHDLDQLDVNALTTDLNDRVDAFINEDLATDQVAGMQVLEIKRKADAQPTDSMERPGTLFVTPTLSKARVDSFEMKVRHFYEAVNEPWFDHYLTYSIAGMRHGPRVNEAELYEQYLQGQPVHYDDPEYVRFLRSFYSEHLYLVHRFTEASLQRAFDAGEADSLKGLLAANEFLKDDRICELVMIDLLYQQYHTQIVKRDGAEKILADVAASSAYPEHRAIATNMLWDIMSMRVGSRLPAMRLEDLRGNEASLDSLLEGPVCIVITASWCSYCDLEMQGVEQLHHDFKDVVPIIVISLDTDVEALKNYVKAHPGMDFRWLRAMAEQRLRDDLRLKSLPAFYLLNDGVLARSPAPLPSNGLGALFQQAKAEAEKGSKIKVWDD